MLHNKKILVVLPAYRAARTLERTFQGIPRDIVDEIILVDDASDDDTVAVARQLGITIFVHAQNLGYGGNQKTCYAEALCSGADVVVMVHPDYQYEPRLITAMAGMITSGVYDIVLGSRILGNTALAGGMPVYKYVANRLLTLIQNLLLGAKLSEFHTGYRAFSRSALESLPLLANSDDFVFDNEVLAEAVAFDLKIGEISCPTRYFPEASSISLGRSVRYGLGVLGVSASYRLWQLGIIKPRIFSRSPTLRLRPQHYTRAGAGLHTDLDLGSRVDGHRPMEASSGDPAATWSVPRGKREWKTVRRSRRPVTPREKGGELAGVLLPRMGSRDES